MHAGALGEGGLGEGGVFAGGGEAVALSPYVYAWGNPISGMDPSGLIPDFDGNEEARQNWFDFRNRGAGRPMTDPAKLEDALRECGGVQLHLCRGDRENQYRRGAGRLLQQFAGDGYLAMYGCSADDYSGCQIGNGERLLGNCFGFDVQEANGHLVAAVYSYHRGNREILQELLQGVGSFASVVAIVGYGSCAFTGVGCAVGAGASNASLVTSLLQAANQCVNRNGSCDAALANFLVSAEWLGIDRGSAHLNEVFKGSFVFDMTGNFLTLVATGPAMVDTPSRVRVPSRL